MNVHLVCVDCQKDFTEKSTGALYVNGAENDMDRLALMISRLKNKLDDIHCTLDSHTLYHIANPIYWVNSSGKNPNPFTIITVEDIENGTWTPSVPNTYKKSLEYVRALKAGGRYDLCIWNPHCRIGTSGHAIHNSVMDALTDWEKSPAIVNMVTKGSNPFTEAYSVVKSEVPDPEDVSTQLNTDFIKTLEKADIIAVAGEASSHCVANSVFDIADSFGDDSFVKKIVFLKDASSPVTGFEHLEKDFLDKMIKRGMKLSTTVDFLK